MFSHGKFIFGHLLIKTCCMKKIPVTILLLSPFFLQAQKRNRPVDSLRYYYGEMSRLRRTYWDSLYKSPEYISINQNIGRLTQKRDEYTGFMLGGELMHNDYREFNKSIADSGFPALKSTAFRVVFGVAFKNNHNIFEMNFFGLGFNNKSEKGQEEIKTGLTSVLQFNYGYDLLKSKYVSIYPYGGFSLRLSNLEYTKPPAINANYTNITNIIANNQSSISSSGRLGYQLGLGIDFLVSKQSGTMFYIKAGTNRPFTEDKYDVEGVKYKPGILQGDWLVGFGFKFTDARH